MEEQIPSSQPPSFQPPAPQYTPEQIEEMKARARQIAIQQAMMQQPQPQAPIQFHRQEPQVVYVRRNLTIAELLVVLAIACGIVTGAQGLWYVGTKVLPNIQITVKD